MGDFKGLDRLVLLNKEKKKSGDLLASVGLQLGSLMSVSIDDHAGLLPVSDSKCPAGFLLLTHFPKRMAGIDALTTPETASDTSTA